MAPVMTTEAPSLPAAVIPRQRTIRIAFVLNIGISCIFMIAAIVAVLHMRSVMRQRALDEAESKARIIIDRNLATHTYFSHNLKPNLFALTDPFVSPDYFDPVWMSSTYAVREIDDYYLALSDKNYYYKEAAIDARSPENEADEFERAFIEQLNADPELVDHSTVRTIDGEPYFVTIRRGETMDAACLRCHSTPENAPGQMLDIYGAERSFDRFLGETISAISIRVPLSDAYAAVDRSFWQLSATVLLALFSLFVIQWLLYARFVFLPVQRIRDKALQIAAGEAAIGEQISLPVDKALAELTSAFNAMSKTLREEKVLLEQRIQQRTQELAKANAELHEDISARQQAESALKKSEAHYRAVVEDQTEFIARLAPDKTITFANQAYCQNYGKPRDEVIGRGLLELIPEEDHAQAVAHLAQLRAEAPVQSFEHWVTRFDGEQRYQRWTDRAFFDQDGTLIGYQTVGTDLTELKHTEEALRERTQTLDRFFTSALDMLCIATTDGHFVRLNVMWEQVLGYRLEEMEGRLFIEFVHPEDVESTLEATAHLAEGRDVLNFANRYRCRDGSYRWIEWRTTSRDGLIYGAARDITDRRLMMEMLRQSEEKHRRLFETMLHGVVYQDRDGTIISANPAAQAILGLTQEQMQIDIAIFSRWHVVREDGSVFSDEDYPAAVALRAGQPVKNVIMGLRDPDQGWTRWISIDAVPIFAPGQNTPYQVYTTFEDITERRRAAEHAAQLALEQEKAHILSRFVEDVSHEFRTPLAVIHSGLDLVERAASHPTMSVSERIVALKRETMYIAELVDAMLTMTKLDSAIHISPTDTEINFMAHSVGDAFQTVAARQNVTLTVETAQNDLLVAGVPEDLERAVGNLVQNAIQFSSTQGLVTLRTAQDGPDAIIEVIDNGPGISDDALPLIFERFYRANTARTGRHTGLGLAITKRIVDLHGGTIEVTSELNVGSTFRVRLPLISAQAE